LIAGYLRAEIKVAQQVGDQYDQSQARIGDGVTPTKDGEIESAGRGDNDGRADGGADGSDDWEGTKGPTKTMMRLEVQQLLAQLEQQEAEHTKAAHALGERLTKLQTENQIKERELATMEERMRRKLGSAQDDAHQAAVDLEGQLAEEKRKRAEEKLVAEATETRLRALLKTATAEVGEKEAHIKDAHDKDLAETKGKYESERADMERSGREERERLLHQAMGMRAELDLLRKLAAEAQAEKRREAQQEEETLKNFLRGMRRGMRVQKHGRNGRKERRQLKFSKAAAAQIAEVFGSAADYPNYGSSPSPSPSANSDSGDMTITWAPRAGSTRTSVSGQVSRLLRTKRASSGGGGSGADTEDSADGASTPRAGQDASVDLGDVEGIENGAHLFARNPIKSPNCISLLLPHRTVDLEFDSSDECHCFAAGIDILQRRRQRKGGSEAGTPSSNAPNFSHQPGDSPARVWLDRNLDSQGFATRDSWSSPGQQRTAAELVCGKGGRGGAWGPSQFSL
jgi:hypothetical protein